VPCCTRAAETALAEFARAMDDDLNTSVALAALQKLVGAVNTRLDALGARPISHAEQARRARRPRAHRRCLQPHRARRQRETPGRPELGAWVEARLAERQQARRPATSPAPTRSAPSSPRAAWWSRTRRTARAGPREG
jgi:cysteinyl-tRNA synthetase